MQTTLGQFNETQSQDAFALQNSKLLKVSLNQVTVQAKLGSMVAYQGDVTFEHAGSGGLGRMLKKAVTGEGTQLMKVTGQGEVFLADQAQDIHLIYLENDMILDPKLTGQLPEVVAEGGYYGMQTFDQHLLKHLHAGRITYEEAMRAATSPHDFKLMVAASGPIADLSTVTEPEPQMTASLTPAPSAAPPAPSAPPPGVPYSG